MTIEEFRRLKPEYKDVEGDELWDAMIRYVLRQHEGSEIMKSIMPTWKTHTLRWLFYRKLPNWQLGSPKADRLTSSKRCASCKNGVNSRLGVLINLGETPEYVSYCPHCGENYQEEPNTNLNHIAWKFYKRTSRMFWLFLDRIHLIRSSTNGRYEMFGDESRYVLAWEISAKTGRTGYRKRKRKWWEHILIERPTHNF